MNDKGIFAKLIREKWEFPDDHAICVPTEFRQHFQLADQDIERWGKALVSKLAFFIFTLVRHLTYHYCSAEASQRLPSSYLIFLTKLPGGSF